MAKPASHIRAASGDGTGQADRPQAALDPDYAPIDERSLKDLLVFARDYAKELNYFGEDDRPEGDWSGLVGAESDLDLAAAYAEDPGLVGASNGHGFGRPHFALLLSYLRLLRHAQDGLNTITKRHLDFYYQQVLRMTKKAPIPDRVHVLLRPSPRTPQVEVPEGSRLVAGKDSLGRDRIYQTDRRLLVNRAEVSRLSAVYSERRVTGIREARESDKGTENEKVLSMIGVALGEPLPGDPLPKYPGVDKVDYAVLQELAALIAFAAAQLFMELFELRDLLRLKQRRDADEGEWRRINELLEIAGRTRSNNPRFRLRPTDPRDFDANLAKALGAAPDFAGLPQVETMDDLYDQRVRQDAKDFIKAELFFERFEHFEEMMQKKDVIDNEWAGINRILELAGQRMREDPSYRLPPDDADEFDPMEFTANLAEAVGNAGFASLGLANIDQYYGALVGLEDYFFMSAENFAYLMAVAEREDSKRSNREWDKIYDILAQAHRTKVLRRRREILKGKLQSADNAAAGFTAVLHFVLGEDPKNAAANPLDRARDFIAADPDFQYLQELHDRLESGAEDGIDWDRIYRILEIAQRARERLPEPVAQIKEWVNLHAHPDVTAATVPAHENDARWRTFGGQLIDIDENNPPAWAIGWGISSPLLTLSAGTRRIRLTLGFEADGYVRSKIEPLFVAGPVPIADYAGPFTVEVSTEKGWIAPDVIEVRHADYKPLSGVEGEVNPALPALQVDLRFSEQVDPVVAPAGDDRLPESEWPVLRLVLRQKWDSENSRFTTDYEPFEHLRLARVHLRVDVGGPEAGGGAGLSEFLIQNDQTTLDPKKPFEPFGNGPAVGSRLFIGHSELIHKRLDRLKFRVEWMGVPENPELYYANYRETGFEWEFKAQVQLVDRRLAVPLGGGKRLFDPTDATNPHSIAIDDIPAALRVTDSQYRYDRILEPVRGQDLLDWSRFLQWELASPDFQHQSYPAIAARKATEAAKVLAGDPESDVTGYLINPPYTPKIKQLGIEYGASLEIVLSDEFTDDSADRMLHLHPFGSHTVRPKTPGAGYRFLPDYGLEAELYLGIANADPPQILSVLFQMADGSANPDLEPVPVEWSYLNGDRWISLADGGVRLDTTRGLINSGIIEFELQPAEPSTRLPADHYWLRAAIARNSDSVCASVAIHAQAVAAAFVDSENASDHYTQPLPKETITGLRPRLPGIAEIIQPYTSFGGRPQEEDRIFYTRVSERLRHKQRALTAWDYERLVLEREPQIYKAKCIPADIVDNPDDAGRLTMVVIPDVRGRLPFDPFEPKAPADLLADIATHLADKTPPFVTVKVVNAHYVRVKVRVGVRFKTGYDERFHVRRLNGDLNRFLSPWAYEEGADIAIGGRIYANSIINFLDAREYVDYVAELKLFASEDNGRTFVLAQPSEADGYFVSTDRIDGVLVADRQHAFDVIAEEIYDEEVFTGINYMKIELDFVVGDSPQT